jgi:hypothetical protein
LVGNRQLCKHYGSKAHFFGTCVRENRKRFGPRTEQVCAGLKDWCTGTTKWRKGGKRR